MKKKREKKLTVHTEHGRGGPRPDAARPTCDLRRRPTRRPALGSHQYQSPRTCHELVEARLGFAEAASRRRSPQTGLPTAPRRTCVRRVDSFTRSCRPTRHTTTYTRAPPPAAAAYPVATSTEAPTRLHPLGAGRMHTCRNSPKVTALAPLHCCTDHTTEIHGPHTPKRSTNSHACLVPPAPVSWVRTLHSRPACASLDCSRLGVSPRELCAGLHRGRVMLEEQIDGRTQIDCDLLHQLQVLKVGRRGVGSRAASSGGRATDGSRATVTSGVDGSGRGGERGIGCGVGCCQRGFGSRAEEIGSNDGRGDWRQRRRCGGR